MNRMEQRTNGRICKPWRQERSLGKRRFSDQMSQEPAQASFVERVPEAGSCSSVGERAVGALGSPPDCFPVLSQVVARWVPPRFDMSRPGPTLPSLAGKRTAGSCGLSTIMMVHVSQDACTCGVPIAGKPPRFCLKCRCTACATPRSIRLPAFSCPLSRCSPLPHRPPLLDLLCVNMTRSA